MITGSPCHHGQNNEKTCAVMTFLKNLLYLYQKPVATNNKYLKEFKARLESIDNYNACILGKFPCLVKKIKNNM